MEINYVVCMTETTTTIPDQTTFGGVSCFGYSTYVSYKCIDVVITRTGIPYKYIFIFLV